MLSVWRPSSAKNMNPQSDNEKIIIAYLLGELPEEELQRFERRYLKDDDLFQELNEIEDELIDDYVSGALSAERRAAFEKHFLRSSERKQKVEFAGAITERANHWKKTQAPEKVSLQPGADQHLSTVGESTETQTKVLPFKRWHDRFRLIPVTKGYFVKLLNFWLAIDEEFEPPF